MAGITHVKTSRYSPQSNRTVDTWHKTAKKAAVRAVRPRDIERARKMIADLARHYKETRVYSALGKITCFAAMNSAQDTIVAARYEAETGKVGSVLAIGRNRTPKKTHPKHRPQRHLGQPD